jgi:hypothetical protein
VQTGQEDMLDIKKWRQGRESNSRIKDLQSSAVPLSHPAVRYQPILKKKRPEGPFNMERVTGFEPVTSTLARSRSTS